MTEPSWADAPTVLSTAADRARLRRRRARPDRQVYRYTDTDGRIVYSDRAPPPAAKNVQPKRLGANYIETSELPIATQQATERFPVTLYTFDCGASAPAPRRCSTAAACRSPR